jgi:hypothetical protein
MKSFWDLQHWGLSANNNGVGKKPGGIALRRHLAFYRDHQKFFEKFFLYSPARRGIKERI